VNQGGSALPDTLLQRAAMNERRVVLAALVIVTALGLWATFHTGDALMSPASPAPGTVAYAVLLFIMWWTMMLAMMLPSAAPAILTYGALSRKFSQQGAATAPLAIFVAGYAAIWTGFSAATVALQMSVEKFVPLTGMMAVISTTLGAALLIAAGLYQLSPLKQACLRKCQTPLMFFARNWRKGYGGALRMGLSHGLYCLGCCWVLMGLLFYGGVMELRWIVGLALYVAAEKMIPASTRLSRFIGILLIGWGLWTVSGLASASATEHHAAKFASMTMRA
jgi:predicted metal-binding membrane protein